MRLMRLCGTAVQTAVAAMIFTVALCGLLVGATLSAIVGLAQSLWD